jgi:hypothetical protein
MSAFTLARISQNRFKRSRLAWISLKIAKRIIKSLNR